MSRVSTPEEREDLIYKVEERKIKNKGDEKGKRIKCESRKATESKRKAVASYKERGGEGRRKRRMGEKGGGGMGRDITEDRDREDAGSWEV